MNMFHEWCTKTNVIISYVQFQKETLWKYKGNTVPQYLNIQHLRVALIAINGLAVCITTSLEEICTTHHNSDVVLVNSTNKEF